MTKILLLGSIHAGGFHAPYQQRMKGIRFDKFAWLQANDDTSSEWPELAAQMRRLQRIPYELNQALGRTQVKDQLRQSPLFMVSCYPGDGALYRRHFDGGRGVGLGVGTDIQTPDLIYNLSL
jgi:hypothetical protein